MAVLRCLCSMGIHRWRNESEAKRYRHNSFWDKTNNRLDPARALIRTCTRCGTKRIWSFNRGCWRKYSQVEEVDTSKAWNITPVEEAVSPPVKQQA